MINILLTAMIVVVLSFVMLWKTSRNKSGSFFMSKDYTSTLKGLCAIVVVFVHVPEAYQNPLQDAVGSFGYIAVTFFFLFSSFGMLYSLEHNPSYMKNFWRNRLLSLLIPNMVINIFIYALGWIVNDPKLSLGLLYTINHYVVVLLEYCVLLYIVVLLQKRFPAITPQIGDAIIISAVVISSLLLYFAKADDEVSAKADWCYERFGLIWGILLYRFMNQIKAWFSSGRISKTAIFVCISLVLGVAYLKFKDVWFLGEFLLKVVLGLSIVTTAFITTYGWQLNNCATRFLGSVSYEIYLAHGYIMGMLMLCVPQLQSGVFLCITLISTIILSYIAHIISSRIVRMCRTSSNAAA